MKVQKKRVAVYGATGCRTCEHGLLEIHHQVQSLSRWAEFVYWPYLLGSGPEELRILDAADVCFITGAVSTDQERQDIEALREKSKVVVACGACAAFGGLPGLCNLRLLQDSEKKETPSTEAGIPGLPSLEPRVSAVSRIVSVDYQVPGCPPVQSLLWAAVQALVCGAQAQSRISYSVSRLPSPITDAVTAGLMPPKGACFAGEKAVCASCSRVKEEKKFKNAVRPYEKYEESGRCLLEQGLICLGIATREGCGGVCTGVGQPCRGCFGKAEAVYDPGTKMVSAVASTFASENAPEIDRMAASIQDLSGTFYRYTLATQCALMNKE